jgi:RecA/RadA recombinase
VEELRRALNERRDSLSVSTVATVEQSLRVADSAIAEAREALQRDPANGVLAEIFASNYERKIDLLRRATELAPRT